MWKKNRRTRKKFVNSSWADRPISGQEILNKIRREKEEGGHFTATLYKGSKGKKKSLRKKWGKIKKKNCENRLSPTFSVYYFKGSKFCRKCRIHQMEIYSSSSLVNQRLIKTELNLVQSSLEWNFVASSSPFFSIHFDQMSRERERERGKVRFLLHQLCNLSTFLWLSSFHSGGRWGRH